MTILLSSCLPGSQCLIAPLSGPVRLAKQIESLSERQRRALGGFLARPDLDEEGRRQQQAWVDALVSGCLAVGSRGRGAGMPEWKRGTVLGTFMLSVEVRWPDEVYRHLVERDGLSQRFRVDRDNVTLHRYCPVSVRCEVWKTEARAAIVYGYQWRTMARIRQSRSFLLHLLAEPSLGEIIWPHLDATWTWKYRDTLPATWWVRALQDDFADRVEAGRIVRALQRVPDSAIHRLAARDLTWFLSHEVAAIRHAAFGLAGRLGAQVQNTVMTRLTR